jgi:hypothetical protein
VGERMVVYISTTTSLATGLAGTCTNGSVIHNIDSLQIRWTNIGQGIGLKKYGGFLIFNRTALQYGFIDPA